MSAYEIIIHTDAPLDLQLVTLSQEADGYAHEARAAATKSAYRSDWLDFVSWCEAHHLPPLPAAEETVARYLTDLAKARKPATLQRRLSAISLAHKATGHATPTNSLRVQDVMRGIRRRVGSAQRAVAPITIAVLRQLLATLSGDLAGLRNRVLLLVGFAGAMRRSELVGLEVGDVEMVAEGMAITIRRSKTDQEGVGHVLGIPSGASPATCPVRAVQAWLAATGLRAGPLLRSVSKHGAVGEGALDGKEVARIIKACAAAAGLDPAIYSGHSLRAGFATTAAEAGVEERDIMEQTRHQSVQMVRRYIREGSRFRGNAAARVGL